MRVRYAVTFEFETRPPLTHRGEVEGTGAHTCAHRAVREAQRQLKPKGWSSLNCVLLERLDSPAEPDSEVDHAKPEAASDDESEGVATPPAPGRDVCG